MRLTEPPLDVNPLDVPEENAADRRLDPLCVCGWPVSAHRDGRCPKEKAPPRLAGLFPEIRR